MKVIYAITNKVNNKRYIGSAIDYKGRKRTHLSRLRLNKHHSIALQRAYAKYGEEVFEFSVLEKIDDPKDLISREQWWIDNTPCEYNICRIAGNSSGVKRSPETLEKMRQSRLGVKHPEWRNKLKSEAQGGINHWQYGKKASEETKSKKSASMLKAYENGYNHPGKKVVLKYSIDDEFICEYESLVEASSHCDKTAKAIGNCLRGKSKVSQGFKWKYKNG